MNILNNRNLPRKIFLVDAAGALMTAVLTGVVLPNMDPSIGMPLSFLRVLGIVAFMYSIYSFLNFYFFTSRWATFLAAIAVANTVYGIVSLVLVFYFGESVTTLGMLYFVLEAIVIAILVAVEWRVSRTNIA
jgi:O-antigen/teichoic acid export membrane protein